jgi:hypothetical protein
MSTQNYVQLIFFYHRCKKNLGKQGYFFTDLLEFACGTHLSVRIFSLFVNKQMEVTC